MDKSQSEEGCSPMGWIVLYGIGGRSFIMVSSGEIHGFTSLEKALDYFESTYNEAHGGSYEKSMSAIIHWITFNPVVVSIYSVSEMNEWFLRDNIGHVRLVASTSAAGTMIGVEVKPELVEELRARGVRPSIISDKIPE